MIYFVLFWAFFKIGLFSFGGGNAMIDPIQRDMAAHGWMSASEFGDIIAISQITPGPLAVNAATYVGVKVAGVLGSTVATLGISLPSFILIIIIAHYFIQFKESKLVKEILGGIKPVTVGMIAAAVVVMAKTSFIEFKVNSKNLFTGFTNIFSNLTKMVQIDIPAFFIFLFVLIAVIKFKVHPIIAVLFSSLLGLFLIQM